jgi:hypothetical protein
MHDVTHIDPLCNGKQGNRLMWHEQVIRDRMLTVTAVRYAGLVMHDYYLSRNGHSRISAGSAAKRLGVSERSIFNARDLLVARGWLKRIGEVGSQTAQYEIAFDNPDLIARRYRSGAIRSAFDFETSRPL